MTKVQLSVRIAPDTLTAIDAEARRLGVSRGHVIDRWLSAQAQAREANAMPVERQAWYRAGELTAKAQDAIDRVAIGSMTTWQRGVIAALCNLVDAINALAGTAPEDARQGRQMR